MKYALKKLLALTIALALLVSMLALPAWAETAEILASGYCGGEGDGTNLTWVLTKDGTLTISGEGSMANWDYYWDCAPWYSLSSNVKSAVIGDSVTTIGDHAFYNCRKLASVTIGKSVTTIGSYAFCYGGQLTSVTIPAAVITIGDHAFRYCSGLTEVTIPDSVITIGMYAFEGCSGLASVIIGDSVTTIGNYAFGDCTSLATVTIGDSVTTIGTAAFYDCWSLTEVTIPDAVTTIGDRAFAMCTRLTEIRFEGDAPIFGKAEISVFSGVTATAYYPTGNETWTKEVMKGYGGTITWVPVNSEGKPVLASGFCGGEGDGTNLTWMLTEDGTLTISGAGAMKNWNSSGDRPWHSYWGSITTVVIEDDVTTIGASAFENCDNLTEVTIGDSVETIGNDAFAWCDALTMVTIPDKVTTIGAYAFCGCTALAEVTFGDSVTTIGYEAFAYCDSLAVVTIPDSVTTISHYAFESCDGLTSVTIGDSVETIGNNAFQSCDSLATVTIGDSVETIGNDAFNYCYSLTEIRFEGDAPSFGNNVFYRVAATAYYPAGNETWTDDVMQDYGGDITWVSATAIQCNSCTGTGTEVTIFAGADVTGTMVGYIAIYDKEGRFLRAEMVEEQDSSAGSLQLSIDYTEEEALQMGRISVYVIDRDTWSPLCREWRKTVNF